MAKYVIAGKSNCPFYARAELLADELKLRLPEFSIHKIVINPIDWETWLVDICKEKGWNYKGGSPLIWRELANRGGKGILLGSCNDFLEMAKGYYGITCTKLTEELLSISNENKETKISLDALEKEKLLASNPFRLTLTNCTVPLAYNILPHLCSGFIADKDQEVNLTLLHNIDDDTLNDRPGLTDGLKMEIEDLAHDQLKNITMTNDTTCALSSMADLIIILVPSRELSTEFVIQLKEMGNVINSSGTDTTKILFAGENAMTSCYIVSKFATNIPRDNFIVMSRFEENKVKSLMGKKLEINSAGITDIVIWGSCHEFIIDYENGKAFGYNGAIWAPHLNEFSHSVKEVIYDKKFLDEEIPQIINNKDRKEIGNYALSFSAALISQVNDIMQPVDSTHVFSLGLISKGWYDVPEGLVYSFPVCMQNGMVNVKLDLEIGEATKEKIKSTATAFDEFCKNLLESIQ